jgi:membrane protease YdiL (CAAX protease family)
MQNRLMNIVADRSPRDGAVAMGAAWLAFVAALPFAESDGVDLAYMLIGGLIGAGLVVTGYAAASRLRPMRPRESSGRVRLAVLAIASGAALGIANLAANFGMAAADPALDQALRERLTTISPWTSMFAAPLFEEVAYRLFFLSVLAWIVARFTKNPRTIFVVAMLISAVVFGMMHLDRPMPDDASLAFLYSTGIVAKTAAASFLLAWIFWRWGLPHAILAHAAANATHELLSPLVFG